MTADMAELLAELERAHTALALAAMQAGQLQAHQADDIRKARDLIRRVRGSLAGNAKSVSEKY